MFCQTRTKPVSWKFVLDTVICTYIFGSYDTRLDASVVNVVGMESVLL